MDNITHLLDTSVYSQSLRRKEGRNSNAVAWWERLGDSRLAVCVISDAEVRTGLIKNRSVRMTEKYEQTLKGSLPTYPIDESVAETFAQMKARQQLIGNEVADLDLLIAACARSHGLIVATLNHRDFSRIEGLAWEDWGRPL